MNACPTIKNYHGEGKIGENLSNENPAFLYKVEL
jgi:hypothetical protein